MMPSVRTSANEPQAIAIVATSATRRAVGEKRRVATAHRTSAGGNTKME